MKCILIGVTFLAVLKLSVSTAIPADYFVEDTPIESDEPSDTLVYTHIVSKISLNRKHLAENSF